MKAIILKMGETLDIKDLRQMRKQLKKEIIWMNNVKKNPADAALFNSMANDEECREVLSKHIKFLIKFMLEELIE